MLAKRWVIYAYPMADRVVVDVKDRAGGAAPSFRPSPRIVHRPNVRRVAKAVARQQKWCDDQNEAELAAALFAAGASQ